MLVDYSLHTGNVHICMTLLRVLLSTALYNLFLLFIVSYDLAIVFFVINATEVLTIY